MHMTANVAPRPLDRLWLRLRPKALSLVRRLTPKPAASGGTHRGTLRQKLEVNRGVDEADLAKLRDKYGIKP